MKNIKKVFLKKIPLIIELLENSRTEILLYNAVNNIADFFEYAYEYIPLSSFDTASDKLVELVDICNKNKSDFNEILIKYNEFICIFKAFFEDYKTDHPVKISFLLPTYNRAKVVEDCVKTILKYEGDNIEIICCDNASPDDTQQRLQAINDKRFKYFRNYENIGGNRNIINVLTKASGDYCFYISDEDHLNINVIQEIFDIVHTNRNVGVITFIKRGCPDTFNIEAGYAVYPAGDQAILNLGIYHYMTGLVFKRAYADIDFLVHQSNLKDHGVLGTYPHAYIAMVACKYGKLIDSYLIGYDHKYQIPSDSTHTVFGTLYNTLTGRTKMFQLFVKNVYELIENKHIFLELIERMIFSYYYMLSDCKYSTATNEQKLINLEYFRNSNISYFNKIIDDKELLRNIYNHLIDYYIYHHYELLKN